MVDGQEEKLHDGRPRNWFWEYNALFDSDLSVHAKIVRLYLARCASNDSRKAWPSISNIAEHCGIGRTTAKKAIQELLETGWLSKETRRAEQGDFATTVYTLLSPPDEKPGPNRKPRGLAPAEPTLLPNDRGRSPDDQPRHEMGGRSPGDQPCHEIAGVGRVATNVGREATNVGRVATNVGREATNVGREATNGRSCGDQGVGRVATNVGREATTNNTNNKTKDNNTKLNNTQGTGLSSEAVSSFHSDTASDAAAGFRPEISGDSYSSVSLSDTSGDEELTARGMIGALGDAFLEVPGMAERYPSGPQRKRVYALIGRLYNRLDSEPVFQAIDSLANAVVKKPVDDPLRYVAGAAEKIAKEMERHRGVSDEDVRKFYAGLKPHVLNPERQAFWEAQYRLAREEGEEIMRQRKAKLDAARDLLENPRHSDDPVLDAIYELQRKGARAIIEEHNDGEAKSIGQYARELIQKLQGGPACTA